MTDESSELNPNPYQDYPHEKKGRFIKFLKLGIVFMILTGIIAVSLYWYISDLNQPPSQFPSDQIVAIEPGTDIRAITEILQDSNVVKSATLLYYTLAFLYDPTQVKASSYVFSEPLTTLEVASRLTEGDFNTDLIRFTHFEGERASHIARRAEEVLPRFDARRFINQAEPQEGKLFPETYFIPDTYTDEELLNLLVTTFEEKILPLQPEIDNFSLDLDKILILASIIEREANDIDSMRLVSSVLQNRLDIGMALQADASIEYVLDKPLSELTPQDLKIDSPYNTYLYPGLPPTPIGNPGLDSILAVLRPAETDYFYYITDDDGDFHYSRTYSKHLQNIDRYLR